MAIKAIEASSCLALLFVGLGSDCTDSVCDPTKSSCSDLQIVAATPRISKMSGGDFFLSIKADRAIGSEARFVLQTAEGMPLAVQIVPTRLDLNGTTVTAQLTIPQDKLSSIPSGVLNLSVSMTAGMLHGTTTTRVYDPPTLTDNPTSPVTNADAKELGAVFIQPVQSPPGRLFLSEKYDKNMFTYRRLARYNYALTEKTIVPFSSFPNYGQLAGRDPGALFAVSQNTAVIGWLTGTMGQVQLYGVSDRATRQLDPIPVGTPVINPLLAADPGGDSLAIATAHDVSLYSITAPGTDQVTVSRLGSCALPATENFQPIALSVQRVEQENTRRVIAISSNAMQSAVTVCESNGTATMTLTENKVLESCLQQQLNALPLIAPVALTVADIDSDGLPDLIYVPTAQPKTLYYIPYTIKSDPNPAVTADCRFWPRQEVTLPSAVTNVQAIAVGDLDGNGRPDVALTTAAPAIRIFLNGGVTP